VPPKETPVRNPIVAARRVYLRPLETADAEPWSRFSADEPEVVMERWRYPVSPLAIEHDIGELHKRQPPENIGLAVCLVDDDRFIGALHLFDIDYVNRTAETGSWIGLPEYRGRGFGTEAKLLLLEYAFDHLQLHVLISYVWEPNARSAAALLKQGYRPAGRYKYEDLKDGVYRDALLFDVLRDDWLAAREAWNARRRPADEP
jgi:RimJ/RimL family protein N-acetyltransferase